MLGLKINTFEPKSGAPDEAIAVVATAPVVTIEAPATIAPVTRIECNRERNVRMLISSTPDLQIYPTAASVGPTQPRHRSMSLHNHLAAQPEVPPRPAGPQRVLPRMRDPLAARLIKAGERAGRHDQPHRSGGPRPGLDCAEGAQHAERTARVVVRSLEVDLHDLSAGPAARVADGYRAGQGLARGDRLGVGGERLVRPVRIGQAVAESEMRLSASPAGSPRAR